MKQLAELLRKAGKLNKNILWTVISILLAVLTINLVLKQNKNISVDGLLDVIAAADKLFFILGVMTAMLYVWFEGLALRSILSKAGYPKSPLKSLLYSTSDIYFSAITPSATGGQPASAYFMIRDGIPVGITAAALVINLTMYTLSIIVLGVISVIMDPGGFLKFGDLSRFLIALGFIILSALAALFFISLKNERLIFIPLSKFITFLYNKKVIREKDRKLAKLEKIRNDYKNCSDLLSKNRKMLSGAFYWNLAQRASQLMTPMLIYRSIGGPDVRMARIFSRQCLVTIGYNFVPIPGGMGVSDYLMLDSLSSIMDERTAIAVELISRGITFYICVTVCGLITLAGWLLLRGKRHEKSSASASINLK